MSGVYFFVKWAADLEARERQAEAEAQKKEEFKITRTLEEEVRTLEQKSGVSYVTIVKI